MKKVIVVLFCALLCQQSAEAGIIGKIKKMFGKVHFASSNYGPGGYAGPAAYGCPAPMQGTGTVWGSPQPMLTSPVFINGQGGMLTTMPGGGYTYFGPTR